MLVARNSTELRRCFYQLLSILEMDPTNVDALVLRDQIVRAAYRSDSDVTRALEGVRLPKEYAFVVIATGALGTRMSKLRKFGAVVAVAMTGAFGLAVRLSWPGLIVAAIFTFAILMALFIKTMAQRLQEDESRLMAAVARELSAR